MNTYQQIAESSELANYKNKTVSTDEMSFWKAEALGKMYDRWIIWNGNCKKRNYSDKYTNAIAQEYLASYRELYRVIVIEEKKVVLPMHTIDEIKQARSHVQQRNLNWLNDLLDEAREAIAGKYDDMPIFKQSCFDNYQKRLAMIHVDAADGSKLVYKK